MLRFLKSISKWTILVNVFLFWAITAQELRHRVQVEIWAQLLNCKISNHPISYNDLLTSHILQWFLNIPYLTMISYQSTCYINFTSTVNQHPPYITATQTTSSSPNVIQSQFITRQFHKRELNYMNKIVKF